MRFSRPQRRAGVRRAWLALGILLWLPPVGLPQAVQAADGGDVEYAVKAAYLYKFAGYIEWPPSTFARADEPMTIGVVGADRLTSELRQQLVGLSVNGHPLIVAPLKPGDGVPAAQILFIGGAETAQLKRLLSEVQSRPVLTVTETAGALGDGSVINFVVADNKVRFEISLTGAQRNGLKVSSRLLSVALQVQGGTP